MDRRSGAMLHALLASIAPLGCGYALTGCGYTLIDYSEPIENLGSVAIQTFENESFEPGVEFVVADALRREFLRRGGVALVDEPIDADLVVSGIVEPIVTRARSFSSVSLAVEWEVVLQLAVDAQWSDGSTTRIDPDSTRATERYLASADIEATRKNRSEAIRTLASNLAAHVHDILYELHQP